MRRIVTVLCLAVMPVLLAVGCSSTPGDAARRSGHPEAAAKLYSQGAAQGDGVAALKLGLLIEKSGITQYGRSGEWFRRGCELGEVVACHNAGVGYEYGDHGLSKNFRDAAAAYREAAIKGYMPSQYNLGSLYSNRYLEDDVEGLAWLLLARTRARACLPQPGCQWTLNDDPGHVKRLRARMSQADQSAGEERAKRWANSK